MRLFRPPRTGSGQGVDLGEVDPDKPRTHAVTGEIARRDPTPDRAGGDAGVLARVGD